jgi:FkbM family methyltransferase
MYLVSLLKAFRKAFLSPLRIKKSYSQLGEDLLIQLILDRSSQVTPFYVDIGCHHPKRGSNTYALYKRGWRGILVDLEDLKVMACRMARPRDTVVKAAISSKREAVTIFSPSEFSTNTTIALSNVRDQAKYTAIGTIQTQTLTDVLRDNSCPSAFGLLNIDVEGVDLEVLKSLDTSLFKPQLICVENWAAMEGLEKLLETEMHQYLTQLGYELRAWRCVSTIYTAQASKKRS